MPLLKKGRVAEIIERETAGNEEEEDDDQFIFPITDIHEDELLKPVNKQQNGIREFERNDGFKPLMTLKQRRRSLLTGNIQTGKFFLSRLDSGVHDLHSPTIEPPTPKQRWKMAFEKIHTMKDPWKKFDLDKYPAEKVTRHRYNAITKKWIVDEAIVKMETEPFNRGAMRTCYRLKKLTNIKPEDKHSLQELAASLTHDRYDWVAQCRNCVAKKYMEDVDKEVYFQDVELQMDAKLWGGEYNRHRPPKQVDIIQMAILEFKDRPGQPFYHLENFIEGNYVKYNSNSGFVEDHWRMTPLTFSHFTFERSGHRMMVVDIQGVGDLYTDPQIHTFDGIQYGDGNLGTRGMALFFHSHVCNDICRSLGLSKFDLYQSEINRNETFNGSGEPDGLDMNAATQIRGVEESLDFGSSLPFSYDHSFLNSFPHTHLVSDDHSKTTFSDDEDDSFKDEGISTLSGSFSRRNRAFLSGSDSSATTNEEEERRMFQAVMRRGSKPSSVHVELQKRSLEVIQCDSILGLVHHELAKYHEIGRFSREGEEIDAKAALFHEQQAADLGVVEAALTLAYIQLGMPHGVLSDIMVQNENKELGFEYMKMAAHGHDRKAMLYLIKAYETGFGLPDDCFLSYKEAAMWCERALDMLETEAESPGFDSTMDDPPYQIKATLARMYLDGGHGLEKDCSKAGDLYSEAAEGATEAMKGKLANKYYSLAEEAYAYADG